MPVIIIKKKKKKKKKKNNQKIVEFVSSIELDDAAQNELRF